MAEIRINGLANTAQTASNDDYVVLDGATNGTRKMLASKLTEGIEQQLATTNQNVAQNAEEITDLKADLKHKTGLSEEAKIALLDCFEHVAWIDEHGQTYYDNLYDALYPESALIRLEATFTQGSAVVYPSTPLDDLKAYLVVTGYYNDGTSGRVTDYALSGTLTTGTSVITVSKDGKTTTFNVTVSAPYWDYEWNASSQTIPTGMTGVDSYDFTTEPGFIYIHHSNATLDFDHIGDCELVIEAKLTFSDGDDASPQIIIKSSAGSESGKYNGAKFYAHKALNDNDVYSNISGSISGLGINATQNHIYDYKCENGALTLSVDGTVVASGTGVRNNLYLPITGIQNSQSTPTAIKSIKFKRL